MRARKRFGQHFLEPAWVNKVVRAIGPQRHETFIEIGPGRGALTRPLAAHAKAVVAYEIDRDLAAALRADAPANVTIVEGDVLETLTSRSPASAADALRVAGNLPYNVASPIMFRLAQLFGEGLPLRDSTLMLQREVANRLTARPASREYGVLSVLMQHVADVDLILKLPPGAFRPQPKVSSGLVRLRFRAAEPKVADQSVFSALVQAVFTRRRKTMTNALLAFGGSELNPMDALAEAKLNGGRRPETLTVAEFARLSDVYARKR